MGIEKLKNDFKMFREHCIIIRRDFNTYTALFFSGWDNLLLKTSPQFFNDIAEIMRRDWILQVCKLMDSPKTKQQGKTLENISIKLIDSQLKAEGLISLEISSLSKAILTYGKKVIPARHKHLAHIDRHHQINGIVLGSTNQTELDEFLDNIQKYCDAVGRAIGIGPLDFSTSCCPGDANDLLAVLKNYFKDV